MIHFTLEEKLAIAGACAAVVALVATIMACKLSPACFLYKLCPFRPTFDDDDDEEISVKIRTNNFHHADRYKLVDYKTLLPAVPSIKVTTLDETANGGSYKQPKQSKNFGVDTPIHEDCAKAAVPDGALLLSRPAKRSTSSISGSSTASSERISPSRARLFPRLRKNSGSGTLSSDCDDAIYNPPPSSLEIGLQYDEALGKLTIVLYRARRIPPNVYGGANDSYVQVIAGKDTGKYWRRRSDIPVDDLLRRKSVSPVRTKSLGIDAAETDGGYVTLAEFQTRTVRKDAEPVFKERFVVDDVKIKDKKNVWIKFILHSIDRFSHQYIVGTRQIGLDRAVHTEADVDREKFNIVLDQYAPSLGDITLSLCYMPTAARLVVTVSKITNLKPPDGLVTANPYVKGVILRRGKVLEKHVTSPQLRTMNPTYSDEPLIFDVPPSELEKIVLLITVVHDDGLSENEPEMAVDGVTPRRRSVGNYLDAVSAVESSFPLHKSRSNSCVPTKGCSTPLGRLAFGSLAAVDVASKRHWGDMICNPRKHVVQTHKLRP